ncbi:hypothetical protein ACFLSG_03115 [Candidatus Bipolaricaulota bacterium]
MIFYDADFGAVSGDYSRLVEKGLEFAYDFFSTEGFAIFPDLIRVDVLETSAGELGAEYLEMDGAGNWVPTIEIANESVMQEYLSYAYTDTSLKDLVASTCAHELFHVIQDYHSLHNAGDISEQSFVEAQATAIQEALVPNANDYLDPALEFLLAPDSMAFFHRSYDAGIFWVYVQDRFGVQAILDLMDSSALYDGRHAIDHAFSSSGLSFFDIWSDFAVMLATGDLVDSEVISTLVPQAEGSGWWTRTRDPAPIPPLVYRETWTGSAISIETVNSTNQSEYSPLYEDDPIGTALRVAHAYGIDVLEIVLDDMTPMTIQFKGEPETQFRTLIASEMSDGWSSAPFTAFATFQPEETMARIRIIITRSEAGTGEYTIIISPSS